MHNKCIEAQKVSFIQISRPGDHLSTNINSILSCWFPELKVND